VDDDRELVARLRAGDNAAATELVDRYAPRLHAMLLHLCQGDAEQAGEFTQEAFARAWERLDRFAGESSFFTWLYRLARNRAIDLLARKRPQAMATDDQRHASSEPTPSRAMAQAELVSAVRHALTQISPEAREIILLRDFEGLDYDAIAEALGIAEGTVKSRLSRARASLRDALAGRITAEDLR
jgi:RNA polymerase sigma-70 factor, ECF subfamily